MSDHAKMLLEKRGECLKQLGVIAAKVSEEKRNYSPEEKQQYDKLNNLQADLKEQADTAYRQEEVAKLAAPEEHGFEHRATNFTYRNTGLQISNKDANQAFKAMLINNVNRFGEKIPMPKEFVESAKRCEFNISHDAISVDNPLCDDTFSKRANNTLTDAAGKYGVDGNVVQGIVDRLVSMGGILNEISYNQRDVGTTFSFATNDDSANSCAIVAEGSAASAGTAFVQGTVSWGKFKYRPNAEELSYEWLRDSKFDVLAWVKDRLATRLWRKISSDITIGTGSTLPFGVCVKSTEGFVSTDAGYSTANFDEAVQLMSSLDELYQQDAIHMMARATMDKYSLIKNIIGTEFDSNDLVSGNNYIFQPSLIAGQPDMIRGKRVVYNPYVPVHGAALRRFHLYGNFKEYIWSTVGDTRLIVDPFTNIKKDCVNVEMFFEGDGNLRDVNAVKHATTKKT